MNNDVEFIRQAQQAKESSYGIFSDTLSSLISNKCKEVIATVYLNINNSLIEEMLTITDTRLIQALGKILYVNALITSGQPLHHNELKTLNSELLYLISTKI